MAERLSEVDALALAIDAGADVLGYSPLPETYIKVLHAGLAAALGPLLVARLAPIEALASELDAAARNRHHEADGAMQAAIAGRLRDALGGRP